MFKRLWLLSFILLACVRLSAQPVAPRDYGWAAFKIEDKKLGTIHFYVDTTNLHKKAPLFIDINGSGGSPLCIYVKGTDYARVYNSFSPLVSEQTASQYHYVILDKPGTPFCDTEIIDGKAEGFSFIDALERYTPSAEYNRRLSIQWRIDATKRVIDWLIDHQFWDGTKIVAYGYSEGGHLAPSLAVADKRITHVVSVVGTGLNQFYDKMERWRIMAAKGELTKVQAQDSIDKFMEIVRDIYRHPEATDKQYDGHTYQRWASFCTTPAFEQLRKLTIPIYMIAGTNDVNSPIYGLDYVPLDFVRLGKTNLTYDVCVGCTHGLVSGDGDKSIEHFNEYLEKIIKWIDAN